MKVPTYYLQARRDGRGYMLTGTRLPFSLWYASDHLAMSFALHMMRDTGGRVWVIDSSGFPAFAETIPPA